MATYNPFELMAMSTDGPLGREYLECRVCGEANSSVTNHNETGLPRCYECSEAAEEARIEAMDREETRLGDMIIVRRSPFSARLVHPGRQQAELNFGEVA